MGNPEVITSLDVDVITKCPQNGVCGKDSKAGAELLTFTVLTTDPNKVVEPLHDRMPVIIPERDYDRWLKPDPERPPLDLLRPFEAEKMTAWKVDKAVGNVKNDRPDLIEPTCCALAPRRPSLSSG